MENLSKEVGRSENLDNEGNLELDSNEDNLTYTPQVSDELRRKKGQQFETIDEVVTFYNAYARAAGFSVRACTNPRNYRIFAFCTSSRFCHDYCSYLILLFLHPLVLHTRIVSK
ncbi:hypothetical protein LguiB_031052 [Lonicera macranthoides]